MSYELDVHCDKSPDGRHELYEEWDYDTGFEGWRCKHHYDFFIDTDDALPLLRAALCLTADEAQELAADLAFDISTEDIYNPVTFNKHMEGHLRNYAARWRGESDED